MAKVALQEVYIVLSKGRTYHYAWRGKGAPRLFSEPGSPDYIAELHHALESRNPLKSHTIAWFCAEYRKSNDYNKLAKSTRKQWAPWLDRIQDHFGGLSIKQFDHPRIRTDIRRWHHSRSDKPRTADMGLQVLSRLLSFAKDEGYLSVNPCSDMRHLYKANRADLIWTDADVEKLEKVASKEVMFAARLAMLTGLRRDDLLKLSWSQIREGCIEVVAGKNEKRVVIPVYDDLARLLAAIPKRATTVLTNQAGLPWKSGFGASWHKAVKKAAIDLHFHDFRGTAATKFYGKLTTVEIANVMGWTEVRVQRMIDRYVKKDELTKDVIRRLSNSS